MDETRSHARSPVVSPGYLAVLLYGWLVSLCVFSGAALADEADRRRVEISLSIFPRIVAVDEQFRQKLDLRGRVDILLVYDADEVGARQLATRLEQQNRSLGGVELVARVGRVGEGLVADTGVPSAVFVAERLTGTQLARLMRDAERERRMVFSPFPGDVERGVTVGLSVTNRVKPYFNMAALARAEVKINPLLLKMSKRYE